MNEVVDKELGCSIQVSHVSVVKEAMELSCVFAFVPQNGEYIKKMITWASTMTGWRRMGGRNLVIE